MDFMQIVLQMNGDISESHRIVWNKLPSFEVYQRTARGFQMMLDEQIPKACSGKGPIRFEVALDQTNGFELQWQQPDSVSAIATFIQHGKLSVTCFLLSGFLPFTMLPR